MATPEQTEIHKLLDPLHEALKDLLNIEGLVTELKTDLKRLIDDFRRQLKEIESISDQFEKKDISTHIREAIKSIFYESEKELRRIIEAMPMSYMKEKKSISYAGVIGLANAELDNLEYELNKH